MPSREIGNEFPFELTSAVSDFTDEWMTHYPPGRRFYFASARAALRSVTRAVGLNPTTPVMLPAFLPADALIPFREVGAPIIFYPVREDLSIHLDDIRKRVAKKTRLLMIVHYFGFPQNVSEIIAWCRKSGIKVVEDLAQSYMTTIDGMPLGRSADFTFNSLRKMLPIPGGSVLTAADERLGATVERTRSVHAFMFSATRTVAMLFGSANDTLPSPQFKRLARYWHDLSDDYLVRDRDPASMSSLSMLIQSRIDPHDIVRTRRQNYLLLLNELKDCGGVRPVFPVIPDGVCPFGFPVYARDRQSLMETLESDRIHTHIHWPLDPSIQPHVYPVSKRIADHILTIPCDQRYGTIEMRRIAAIIRRFAERPEKSESAGGKNAAERAAV